MVICGALMLGSCAKNDPIILDQSVETSKNKRDKELTEEELLRKGWTIIERIDLTSGKTKPRMSNTLANASSDAQQPTPLDVKHLKDMGYDISEEDDKGRLKQAFNVEGGQVDGVWFNETLNVDGDTKNEAGSKPDAHILLGKPTTVVKTPEKMPDDVFITYVVNEGSSELTQTVEYDYKEGHKTSWQQKTSTNLKLGVRAKVNFIVDELEVSAEVTVGGETTSGEEKSYETTKKAKTDVKVPPNRMKKIMVTTQHAFSTVEYTFPIILGGNVRVNYHKPANGHYFWEYPITDVRTFKPQITNEIGTATGVKNLQVIVWAGKDEPIDKNKIKSIVKN